MLKTKIQITNLEIDNYSELDSGIWRDIDDYDEILTPLAPLSTTALTYPNQSESATGI